MKKSILPGISVILLGYLLILTSACQPLNSDDRLVTTVNTRVAIQPTQTADLTLPPSSSVTLSPTPPPAPTKAPPTQPTLTSAPLRTPVATPSATLTPTSTATRTILDGWLVFESRRHDTNGDSAIDMQDGIHIYTLNLATNEVNQLTTGNQFDLKPTWSPDGSQIAFMSNRDGNYELYTMNADGTNLTRLTYTAENEGTPTWSPDGTQIAYVVVSRLDSGLEKREIFLLSVHDQQTYTLGANDLTNTIEPDWSPDGRFLVFTGQTDVTENGVTSYDNAIYLLDISANTIHRLTSPDVQVSDPKWLPRDGYFLSILQSPGVFSSDSINVFELRQNAGRFLLQQVFVMEDVIYNYVWGTNSEWFISMTSNNLQDATVDAEFNSLDLAVAPVDFTTQQYSGTSLGGSYNYSFIEESRLLTDNTFYDGFPDWTP